jgi:ABC-type glycerol-3-phosphate transport system substrate-binding protein
MKNTLINCFIRLIGSLKRSIRRRKIFGKQHSKAILYTSLSTVSIVAVTIIIVLINGGNLGGTTSTTPAPKLEISPSPSPSPTAIPVVHIDKAPLVVLDCSQIDDNDFILQTVDSFGKQNNIESKYTKVSEDDFIKTYRSMAKSNNTPSVVIAPSHIIKELGELQNISDVSREVLFNKVAQGALKDDMMPLALSMYGYYFRTDLLYILSQDMPRTYHNILDIAESMRSDKAYKYLTRKEKDKNKKNKKDLFETSRYGFGFSGGDIGGELFIEQAITEQIDDKNILHDIKFMWDELYLPPDTA